MTKAELDDQLSEAFYQGANCYREAAAVVLGLGLERRKRVDAKFEELIERWKGVRVDGK